MAASVRTSGARQGPNPNQGEGRVGRTHPPLHDRQWNSDLGAGANTALDRSFGEPACVLGNRPSLAGIGCRSSGACRGPTGARSTARIGRQHVSSRNLTTMYLPSLVSTSDHTRLSGKDCYRRVNKMSIDASNLRQNILALHLPISGWNPPINRPYFLLSDRPFGITIARPRPSVVFHRGRGAVCKRQQPVACRGGECLTDCQRKRFFNACCKNLVPKPRSGRVFDARQANYR